MLKKCHSQGNLPGCFSLLLAIWRQGQAVHRLLSFSGAYMGLKMMMQSICFLLVGLGPAQNGDVLHGLAFREDG